MIDFFIEKLSSIKKWGEQNGSLLAIGIDAGFISLIEMSQGEDNFIVKSYASERLPTQPTEPLTATMARLLKRSGSRCRRLVIALAEPWVMVRKLKLRPDQSLEDIQDEIELIFDQLIPFPLEESGYDYLIQEVGNNSRDCLDGFSPDKIWEKFEKPAQEILLVASLRKTIAEHVDSYRSVGLNVVMVTLASLSTLRAIYSILKDGPESMANHANIAFLELRQAKTTFSFFQNNRMILTRTLSSVLEESNPKNQTLLCEELVLILKQLYTEVTDVSIKYFILAGEPTWIERLKPVMENRLNVEMIVANGVTNMVFSRAMAVADQQKMTAEASLLLPSFGLLLCGLETEQGIERKRKINLLPWRAEKRKRENKQFFCLLSFLIALMVIVVMGMAVYFYIQAMQVDANLSHLLKIKQTFSDKITLTKKLEEDKKHLLNRIQLIQDLQKDASRWVRFFDVLPRLLPDGVYLKSLTGKQEQVILEGNAHTHAAVAALLQALADCQGSCFFEDIQLTEVTLDKQESGLKFNIQCLFKTLHEETVLENKTPENSDGV